MIPLETALSAVRFGTGLHPRQAPPAGPDALMAQLKEGPGFAGPRPAPDYAERWALITGVREAKEAMEGGGSADMGDVKEQRREMNLGGLAESQRLLARHVGSPHGFFERLSMFWTDHFTVAADNNRLMLFLGDMIETAIRPNIAGSFPEMVKAVVRHPAMLQYLNQSASTGPNSAAGTRRERGLNENLARELLELHTLGVDGGYAQRDVRELAELLTGFSLGPEGFVFRANRAEPGAETVLGRSYGGARRPQPEEVDAALVDLALHPETAEHLARKLVVHFLGAPAPDDLVQRMANVYLRREGRLAPVYAAMLEDERAWAPELRKARTPLDFATASARALGMPPRAIAEMGVGPFRNRVLAPLEAMGQPFLNPTGPDGWAEDPEAWITPSGLAARVSWAGAIARDRARDVDPRSFVETALGPLASETLRRAAAGAETKAEGVAIVLASPEFNRR